MKRVLNILAALTLAAAGVLVAGSPAAAQEIAACLVSNETITINTASNTSAISYDLSCPVILGYESPGTAACSGSGPGDRASLINAWTSTEDTCDFTSDGDVVGQAVFDMDRTWVLVPVTGSSTEAGTGVELEGGLFAPSVEDSEVAGHFTVSGNYLTVTSASLPANFNLVTG